MFVEVYYRRNVEDERARGERTSEKNLIAANSFYDVLFMFELSIPGFNFVLVVDAAASTLYLN